MDTLLRFAGIITCLMLGACFGDISDPMVVSDRQLEALEENQAAWPTLNEDGSYPEAMEVLMGDDGLQTLMTAAVRAAENRGRELGA